MSESDARSTAKDSIDQLENDFDDIREEASETLRDIKSEVKSAGVKVKTKAREAAAQTVEKIKNTASGAADYRYPADADRATRTGMYVGVGLVAAGFVIGVAALLYGKSEKRGPTRTAKTPDEVTGRLARARAEAADKKGSRVIVTPPEHEQEEA